MAGAGKLAASLGPLLVPVIVYALVLAVMASSALLAELGNPLAAIGALLFVASDAMLAIAKFRGPFAGHDPLIWITYYLAQALIFLAVERHAREQSIVIGVSAERNSALLYSSALVGVRQLHLDPDNRRHFRYRLHQKTGNRAYNLNLSARSKAAQQPLSAVTSPSAQYKEIMMQGRRFAFPALLAVILLAMTSIANAGPYSNVFVYGDSLSDTGNIYDASGRHDSAVAAVLRWPLFQRTAGGGIPGQLARARH